MLYGCRLCMQRTASLVLVRGLIWLTAGSLSLIGCVTDANRLPQLYLPSDPGDAGADRPPPSSDSGSDVPPDASVSTAMDAGTDGLEGATESEVVDAGSAGGDGGQRDAATGGEDAGGRPAAPDSGLSPVVECPGVLNGRYEWEQLDWSGVTVESIPASQKIFDAQHPSCDLVPEACQVAESDSRLEVVVHTYLDSTIWLTPAQLETYLELVNRYFAQAGIRFEFDFRLDEEPPALTDNVDQLTLIFGSATLSPGGNNTDAFGNLPSGKAVVNDSLMGRDHINANPYFVPGKTIGFVLGLVLGSAIVPGPPALLMAQGTGLSNGLELLPEQAVIMRSLAMARFGATVDPPNFCPGIH